MQKSSPAAVPQEITTEGPEGPLAGMLMEAGGKQPLILIIPGSGPTDRDGNSPMGISASSYRLLAEALAQRNISTVRIDKRGMFGSVSAVTDANKVTIADYVADIKSWTDSLKTLTGRECIWLAGHSEGGLVALASAAGNDNICGVVLIAAAGRPLGDVMREQFRANPANAPILGAALGAIGELEKGRAVDVAQLPGPLAMIFARQVQGYLIDLLSYDPAILASKITQPMLIVQGGRDIQVSAIDAEMLAQANSHGELRIIPDITHVLKSVDSDDRMANMTTYASPDLPISPVLVDVIATFVKK